jgi:hypothetical protein
MKRTHLFLFILLSLSVIAAGCTGYESSSPQSVYPESDMIYDLEETSAFDGGSSYKLADNGASSQSSITRKVITTSSVSLEVKNTPEALDDISDIADEFDGYVSSSSVYTRYDDEGMYGYITIRVPSSELDKALETIGDLGKVTSKSTTASDVTEEYIDVNARLSNLEKQETRLGEILEMSTTVATINVDVSEPRNITHSWGLRDALSDSVRGFIGSVNGIIVFIGVAIPIVIFASIVGVMLILVKRRVWR